MRTFKPYAPKQIYLLPPDLAEWLPEGHLASFISDVIDQLNLRDILFSYENSDDRGQPPYHPSMMLKILVYGYCTGKPSSRKIEKATWEDVAYRVLATNQHPDHDSIAEFRKRHLPVLAGLFLQVLKLCQAAGLVKLGHVALDGSKVKANASKHKAMSYDRMGKAEEQLEKEIARLLEEAGNADEAEDAKYGKGKRGDELPEELQRRESRLIKIRAAKAALEAEAKAAAEKKTKEVEEKLAKRAEEEARTGKKTKGKPPVAPDPEATRPEAKAQKNFTDPESRIMKDGASKGFEQAYNAQIVVESTAQIIVAEDITQESNDKKQLVPMLVKTKENLGNLPENVSADAGYFSETNITAPELKDFNLHIPPDRQKHGDKALPVDDKKVEVEGLSVAEKMRNKLMTKAGHDIYRFRKAIVEPVFGQIKEARGFRRFSMRGLVKVKAEWTLVCLTHNLLKLFRSGWLPQAV
jgi:transposase